MNLNPPDCAIAIVAVVSGVLGAFNGFSGALAFAGGIAGGAIVSRIAWPMSAQWFSMSWARALMTLVVGLVAFGVIRMIIRKVVGKLLAQPADAIFGFVLASIVGCALALFAIWGLGQLGAIDATSCRMLSAVLSYFSR